MEGVEGVYVCVRVYGVDGAREGRFNLEENTRSRPLFCRKKWWKCGENVKMEKIGKKWKKERNERKRKWETRERSGK